MNRVKTGSDEILRPVRCQVITWATVKLRIWTVATKGKLSSNIPSQTLSQYMKQAIYMALVHGYGMVLGNHYNPVTTLRWRYNERDIVSNHQPHDCVLNRLFRRRSKKTSKLRVTGLCAGNSPGISKFPAQMASNAENVSIWWRHHAECMLTSSFIHTER